MDSVVVSLGSMMELCCTRATRPRMTHNSAGADNDAISVDLMVFDRGREPEREEQGFGDGLQIAVMGDCWRCYEGQSYRPTNYTSPTPSRAFRITSHKITWSKQNKIHVNSKNLEIFPTYTISRGWSILPIIGIIAIVYFKWKFFLETYIWSFE